jgi:hypothetical protein
MKSLDPIFSFSDHPSLKGDPRSTLYCCPDRNNHIKFYYANYEELVEIGLSSLAYCNMGEPYRVLARLYFIKFNNCHKETINISMEDAVRLYKYLQKINMMVLVSKDLLTDNTFKKYLEVYED